MALPKLLQKLFQNGGAGAKLNESIMPYAYARSVNGREPDETGNIAVPSRNVGEEWHSFTGQIPVGGVPYCGQEVTRATYADLWAWVQAQGLVKTESEWQALNTSQNGNVPFYSDGDGSTTFRMPKVVGYIRGAASQAEAGAYTAEGLPNHTHYVSRNCDISNEFVTNTDPAAAGDTVGNYNGYGTKLTSSVLNDPIYGHSDHVTPETSVILFGVYAFGEITNVGALDADALATGLAAAESNLAAVEANLAEKLDRGDKSEIASWGMPDYSSGVSKAWDVNLTAESNGWVFYQCSVVGTGIQEGTLLIDGIVVARDYAEWQDAECHSHLVPIAKGSTFKATQGGAMKVLIFYPCKGV